MPTHTHHLTAQNKQALPETLEVILSALVGCGLVFVLAFFLSLETWVIAAVG